VELVIFSGIPASGKSTFYSERLRSSHSVVSLDLVKTREAENDLFSDVIKRGEKVVVDNTNPLVEDRARYIVLARAAGYTIFGYQFEIPVKTALARNSKRTRRVPPVAIMAINKKMVDLCYSEGFDRIYIVSSRSACTVRIKPFNTP
jgi:predicted kinase